MSTRVLPYDKCENCEKKFSPASDRDLDIRHVHEGSKMPNVNFAIKSFEQLEKTLCQIRNFPCDHGHKKTNHKGMSVELNHCDR